jgi:hypothetical protein
MDSAALREAAPVTDASGVFMSSEGAGEGSSENGLGVLSSYESMIDEDS